MLEFLELNNLLGVSHFTFYNHTIGPKAGCVLKHYMDGKVPQQFAVNSSLRPNSSDKNASTEGATHVRSNKITVDLLTWNLKMKSQKEIRTEGLFASLNDCLYRSMYRWVGWLIAVPCFMNANCLPLVLRFSHVALIDLDEFIIPRHNDTISDLIEWVHIRSITRRGANDSANFSDGYQNGLTTRTPAHILFKMRFSTCNLQMTSLFTTRSHPIRSFEHHCWRRKKQEGSGWIKTASD